VKAMKKITFKENENNTVIIVGTAFEAETLYKKALASEEAFPLVVEPMPKFNPCKMYGVMFYDVEGFDGPEFKVVTTDGIVQMLDGSVEVLEYVPEWDSSIIMLENKFTKEKNFFRSLAEAKEYFFPYGEDREIKDPENYVGNDFPAFLAQWEEYKAGFWEAETPEQLVEHLNRFADILGDGSEWHVKNI
jgi:hypothetical protein